MPDFGHDGFALLPEFLEPAELEGLRSAVDQTLAAPLPPGCERPHNSLAPLRWNSPVVEQVLSGRSRMAALEEAIGARDLRWISAYVSVKEARTPALWWHQDWWCWDHPVSYHRAPSQVAVLCYLADMSPGNGALRLLPGTHHRSVALHALLPEAHTAEAAELDVSQPAFSDQPGQVTAELESGGAVVIDYRLLHGTHANGAGERRDCLLFSFAPAWCELPLDVRAHLSRHPALPGPQEHPDPSWPRHLLPTLDAPARDLPLNRVAPREFGVVD
jgi:ectoine hydroxylase-related dioxygenase (phytanoyl-CoA dioxygenase family)